MGHSLKEMCFIDWVITSNMWWAMSEGSGKVEEKAFGHVWGSGKVARRVWFWENKWRW